MILVDTTPLVALCDPADRLNARALADLGRLAKRPLLVCHPIITESCFLLPRAVERRRLSALLTAFDVATYQTEDERGLWQEVFDWLDRYEEHDPDWADGYLAVVSNRERKFKLWTYDSEFRDAWRRPDGSRIPLAVS